VTDPAVSRQRAAESVCLVLSGPLSRQHLDDGGRRRSHLSRCCRCTFHTTNRPPTYRTHHPPPTALPLSRSRACDDHPATNRAPAVHVKKNKYIGPPYSRAKIYAARVSSGSSSCRSKSAARARPQQQTRRPPPLLGNSLTTEQNVESLTTRRNLESDKEDGRHGPSPDTSPLGRE